MYGTKMNKKQKEIAKFKLWEKSSHAKAITYQYSGLLTANNNKIYDIIASFQLHAVHK